MPSTALAFSSTTALTTSLQPEIVIGDDVTGITTNLRMHETLDYLYPSFDSLTSEMSFRASLGVPTGTIIRIKNVRNVPVTITTDNSTAGSWQIRCTSDSTNTSLDTGWSLEEVAWTIAPQDTRKSLIQSFLRERYRIGGRSRVSLDAGISPQEFKARNTLRDLLSEKEWRRYVTNGFIMVRGASGKWYQVFNRYAQKILVFQNGKCVESLCVHTDTRCPPTDHVLNMKALIEIDEEEIYRRSNRYAPYGGGGGVSMTTAGERESLLSFFKKLKAPSANSGSLLYTVNEDHAIAG